MVGVSYKTDSVTEQEHFSPSKENHSSATKNTAFKRNTLLG